VRAIFAERAEGVLTLRRGFDLDAGDRVVIIEDVLTTGGSTRETMEVAKQKGAAVVAAGAVINRSGLDSPVDVPFVALAALRPPTYKPEDCPLCAAGDPVVKPGSRGEKK
jgi:orotate phosphoribosyltransferase